MDLIPKPATHQSLRSSPLDQTVGPRLVTRQLREVFREAFDRMGGADWLVQFATANDQNARVFVQAISKLLPASATPEGKEKIIIDIPWLTKDRLAYKDADNQPVDADVIQLIPAAPQDE